MDNHPPELKQLDLVSHDFDATREVARSISP